MQDIYDLFLNTRRATLDLCEPLAVEDFGVQTCPDVSPPKWHLGHTAWFFEKFLLAKFLPDYQVFHEKFDYIFNSYYQTFGARLPRENRSFASRPTVQDVIAYRRHVENHMATLFDSQLPSSEQANEVNALTTLGIHHEQQHQELLLMDILNIFARNPMQPIYNKDFCIPGGSTRSLTWESIPRDDYEIGFEGGGFCFDNEIPKHTQKVNGCAIASRLVRNSEFLEFMESGAYENHDLWLADGWDWVQKNQIRHPLYWQQQGYTWQEMSLAGLRPLRLEDPVCHVSFYEASAYASWKNARLPTEAEREVAEVANLGLEDKGVLWEWTQSPYVAYPGFMPPTGAIGEYNGKFMCNQLVLRGGCFATPAGHSRASYRNFYYPHQRWMFSGIRLARDE